MKLNSIMSLSELEDLIAMIKKQNDEIGRIRNILSSYQNEHEIQEDSSHVPNINE